MVFAHFQLRVLSQWAACLHTISLFSECRSPETKSVRLGPQMKGRPEAPRSINPILWDLGFIVNMFSINCNGQIFVPLLSFYMWSLTLWISVLLLNHFSVSTRESSMDYLCVGMFFKSSKESWWVWVVVLNSACWLEGESILIDTNTVI